MLPKITWFTHLQAQCTWHGIINFGDCPAIKLSTDSLCLLNTSNWIESFFLDSIYSTCCIFFIPVVFAHDKEGRKEIHLLVTHYILLHNLLLYLFFACLQKVPCIHVCFPKNLPAWFIVFIQYSLKNLGICQKWGILCKFKKSEQHQMNCNPWI